MAVHKYVSRVSCVLIALSLVACSSEESATVSDQGSQMGAEVELPASATEQTSEEPATGEVQIEEAPTANETDESFIEPDSKPIEEAAAEVEADTDTDTETEIDADARLLVHDDGLPEGLGKKEFEKICSDCHAVATAIGLRRSQSEWGVVIQEMRDMGADASNIEAGLILAYLSQNFGT